LSLGIWPRIALIRSGSDTNPLIPTRAPSRGGESRGSRRLGAEAASRSRAATGWSGDLGKRGGARVGEWAERSSLRTRAEALEPLPPARAAASA
jgi:hypothetical protein